MKNIIFIIMTTFISLSSQAENKKDESKAGWFDFYEINNIDLPYETNPQVGAIAALRDGRLAVTFQDGNVLIYSISNKSWSKYAEGLYQPLGIIEDDDGSLVVMQNAELTRLIDEDRDGTADFYQTITDDFGLSGNYHEFAFGPAQDSKGNYYISLNLASNYAGINEYTRGEYSPLCQKKEFMRQWHDKDIWLEKYRPKVTRMFSCVNHRGWILKVKPDGETTPYALGMRSPNGIYMDKKDQLWVTDNQGDWIGTSPLFLVEKDDFLGHISSLVWTKGWTKRLENIVPSDVEHLKKAPAALFPQGELANSPTQPISTVNPALFGLPEGELIIGDMNQANLIRFIPDPIKGTMQGTLLPFIEGDELGIGNNRFAFSDDGDLWIGKINMGWAGDEGLKRVTWNKKPYLFIKNVKLTQSGFDIEFSQPLIDDDFQIDISRHTYHYHKEYGSEKVDLRTVKVVSSILNSEKTKLHITLPSMVENRLYTVSISGAKNIKHQPLLGDRFWYNLVKMK